VIISASRRTDIPAFYQVWLMRRIEQGFCLVPNPFRPSQVSRISLLPEHVTAFVFWSKNPKPMVPSLTRLDRLGYPYYFLFTLNDYPAELEPHLPLLVERINTFLEISGQVGPHRIIWRYDPIVLSTITTASYHQIRFERLCRAMSGHTARVIVSALDFYRKTARRLEQLRDRGIIFERTSAKEIETARLLLQLSEIAASYRIELQSCAEEPELAINGVKPGACIDPSLIDYLASLRRSHSQVEATLTRASEYKKDNGQRAQCLCVESKDIGAFDTCLHGCRYCYATNSDSVARRRFATHDPSSPTLWTPS
jgi:hypothetical protein